MRFFVKAFLFIVIIPFLSSCFYRNGIDTREMISRYVIVWTDDGFGSGVQIGNKYVITAQHVVINCSHWAIINDELIDSVVSVVDSVEDQALLKGTYCKSKSPIVVNQHVYLGEIIYWIQPLTFYDSLNVPHLHLYHNTGYINRIYTNHFSINQAILPGASGSGVFNTDGELIGIIEKSVGIDNQIVYGVAAQVSAFETLLTKIQIANNIDSAKIR